MQFCNLYIRFILNSLPVKVMNSFCIDPDEGNMARNEQEGQLL